MRTKILYFPPGHFKRKKQPPLTSLMILTILDACAKQKEGIPFGPTDIKGSFTALITRGLIIRKDITINEHTESIWQVSTEAVRILKIMGIDVSC